MVVCAFVEEEKRFLEKGTRPETVFSSCSEVGEFLLGHSLRKPYQGVGDGVVLCQS